MALDLTDVVNSVRQTLLDLYNPGAATTAGHATSAGTVFLAFEPLGRAVPPQMFQVSPSNPALSPALATEILSGLANAVPEVNADTYFRTGKTIDAQYNLLMQGSQPAPGTPASSLALFTQVKANAVQTFDEIKLGSMLSPLSTFHPVTGEPTNWYDPSVAANWTSLHFQSSPPPAPPPPPPPPPGGTGHPPPHPPIVNPPIVHPPIGHPPIMLPMLHLPTLSVLAPPTSSVHPWQWQVVAPEQRPLLKSVGAARLNMDATLAKAAAIDLVQNRASVEVHALVNATTSVPPESQSIELTCQACSVALDRPWLSWAFLETRGWFVPGFLAGDFAPGALWPVLPIGMIAVRNLVIQAKGCPDDSVAHSTGFGPFSLIGASPTVSSAAGHFDVTVSAPGPQIIAWIAQVLAGLPPQSDPSLAHP
jgi:hypothetical protein